LVQDSECVSRIQNRQEELARAWYRVHVRAYAGQLCAHL
jgi:hypothetical protein